MVIGEDGMSVELELLNIDSWVSILTACYFRVEVSCDRTTYINKVLNGRASTGRLLTVHMSIRIGVG